MIAHPCMFIIVWILLGALTQKLGSPWQSWSKALEFSVQQLTKCGHGWTIPCICVERIVWWRLSGLVKASDHYKTWTLSFALMLLIDPVSHHIIGNAWRVYGGWSGTGSRCIQARYNRCHHDSDRIIFPSNCYGFYYVLYYILVCNGLPDYHCEYLHCPVVVLMRLPYTVYVM